MIIFKNKKWNPEPTPPWQKKTVRKRKTK